VKITEVKDGILIGIKVIPGSSKNTYELQDDFLKVKLIAPPVDGKANKELINYLSGLTHLKKRDIEIRNGETARKKTIFLRLCKDDFIKIIGETK